MKSFLKRHILTISGILIGALGGYIYFLNWGCTESCAIRSHAGTMTLYGAVMGGLFLNFVQGLIQREKS